MTLDVSQPKLNKSVRSLSINYSNRTDKWSSQQEVQPNVWVKLLELPNPYSFDEALLLCKHSEDEWVAWIPSHGEAILHNRQFC